MHSLEVKALCQSSRPSVIQVLFLHHPFLMGHLGSVLPSAFKALCLLLYSPVTPMHGNHLFASPPISEAVPKEAR